MQNELVPELAVTDCVRSKQFYCDILGFEVIYERPEEGFAALRLGASEIMIDQIGLGRTFGDTHAPQSYPFGKGLNIQIRVPSAKQLLDTVRATDWAIYLPLEDRWYRRGDKEIGQRQFVVADPDGYLLRFAESLGSRPVRT